MDSLSDRQRLLLERLPGQQRVARIGGIVLSVAGIVYLVWAVTRFDPLGDPTASVGFDAPVTQPVASLYIEAEARLEAIPIETPREKALAYRLHRLLDFSAGLFLLAFRVILGVIATLLGFAVLTVVIERGRLLQILAAAGIPDGEAPPTPVRDAP